MSYDREGTFITLIWLSGMCSIHRPLFSHDYPKEAGRQPVERLITSYLLIEFLKRP